MHHFTLHYRRIRGNIIDTYKILTGKYAAFISPTMTVSSTSITRSNDLSHFEVTKTDLNMIYGNIVLLTGLLIHGIVYLTVL